ncbi:hypothetical protein G5I_08021 [Acromyrmex echinatior]|uniref:Uncharacterized protein n=1 Tax=Acromyrmex echinatior TaxID=103372 RepID=F4WQD4_ACREC|nr:hypothetical protein G5I_08021 [Acromyrmex echinatior]
MSRIVGTAATPHPAAGASAAAADPVSILKFRAVAADPASIPKMRCGIITWTFVWEIGGTSSMYRLLHKAPSMRVERELLEQCGQVATLMECFSWLQRCDECIEQLEELCRAKRQRLTIRYRQSARLAGTKLELERRFIHIDGEYASGEYASGNDLLSGERSTRLRVVY